MTGQRRVFNLRFGKHASTSDFTSTPGTLHQLSPEGDPGFKPVGRMKLERGGVNAAGRFLSPLAGPNMLGDHQLEQILSGISGNAGGALDAAAESEVGAILDVITGTAAVNPSSTATTATGGSTTSVTVTSGVNISNGVGILFSNGTDTVAREVVSGGGSGTLTIDRNSGGTPTGTIIRSSYWTINPAISMHTHGYFAGEGEDYERLFFGCMGTGKITAAMNDYCKLVTSWKPNNITDSPEDDPTFTAHTTGQAIVAVASTMYLGNTAYTFKDLEIDFGGTIVARQAHNGTHGVHGYAVFDKKPKIRGKFYLGAISALLEHDDSASSPLNTTIGQGTDKSVGAALTTFDVGIQIGTLATGCAYFRAPLAAFTKYDPISIDGMEGFDFELTCYGPTTGTPLHIHLF